MSKVLSEKLKGPLVAKIFHAFYETQRFITALTTARHVPVLDQINLVHNAIPNS
jgi:hypothetical protein